MGAPGAVGGAPWYPRRVRRRSLTLLILPALLALACDGASSTPPGTAASPGPAAALPSGAPAAKVDVGPTQVDAIHRYTGGAQKGDRVPLVVAIHGLGDRPDSFVHLLDDLGARAHLVIPAGGLAWGGGFAWWPIPAHIDENNMAEGLGAAADRVAGALRGWMAEGAAGKPIVTGFSQGGMLSFALAAKYPELVGEAIPVAGLLPGPMMPAAWPAGAPKPKIVALHGDADGRVPFALGRASADRLGALGLQVELKTYPGVAHTLSADMRRDMLAALTDAIQRAEKAP